MMLPRGTCPVCDNGVVVRQDGGLTLHYTRASSGPPGFSQPAGTRVKCGRNAHGAERCSGTDRPSVEAIEAELEQRNGRASGG